MTRGFRKPLGVLNGLHRLVEYYNDEAEDEISVRDVMVHEVLLHLNWLADAMKQVRSGGSDPKHYANLLGGILRSARAVN
jgi:hypothetical protein